MRLNKRCLKNLFKKSYTSINTNDHGSAGVSRAESAKADKRAAEAAQEKTGEDSEPSDGDDAGKSAFFMA